MRSCIVCQKSAPVITFSKPGAGVNEICDCCIMNGKIGKFIKSLMKSKEDVITETNTTFAELERKVVIKDLTIKRLQQDMRNAKIKTDHLTAENEKLNFASMELSFKEQSFKESDSQISLLNELVNTGSFVSFIINRIFDTFQLKSRLRHQP